MGEQELNRYWKTVVDTIQDGVMIVDTAGIIVFINPAFEKITGYSENDIVGKPCTILDCNMCEISRMEGNCKWCVLFRHGELNNKQCCIIRKDGTPVHVIKNACVLNGETEGEVTGAVETLTDISAIISRDRQIEGFRRELASLDTFHGIIGNSSEMQKVFDLIISAAQSDAPVIIKGESGTGKEMVAKAIHERSDRKDSSYIKVNCSALNESILESELFGHVRGAFTGAMKNRCGKFEAAGDGNIFLDEIGEISLSTQVKLLRVLEEKTVEKVGDNTPIKINARIISATNQDLEKLISMGKFREDFYYRINVIPISLPPLRERTEDIPMLAESFFKRIQLKRGNDVIQGISNEALNALASHHWPGNVRELKSAFEYAFVTCKEKMIRLEHLPPSISKNNKKKGTTSPCAKEIDSLDAIKKKRLLAALEKTQGNRTETARILGISRTSVWNQIKKYKILPPVSIKNKNLKKEKL